MTRGCMSSLLAFIVGCLSLAVEWLYLPIPWSRHWRRFGDT